MNEPVYLGFSILEINIKINIRNTDIKKFGMTVLNQRIKLMQDHATWIQIALLFILKLKMFGKILQMMLKKTFETSNYEADRPM